MSSPDDVRACFASQPLHSALQPTWPIGLLGTLLGYDHQSGVGMWGTVTLTFDLWRNLEKNQSCSMYVHLATNRFVGMMDYVFRFADLAFNHAPTNYELRRQLFGFSWLLHIARQVAAATKIRGTLSRRGCVFAEPKQTLPDRPTDRATTRQQPPPSLSPPLGPFSLMAMGSTL